MSAWKHGLTNERMAITLVLVIYVVDNNENNVFMTHEYALLGFAASGWRHFGVILQPVDHR